MCSYCNYRIVPMKVYCGFWSVQLILLFVALVELLGLCIPFFLVCEILVVCE
jgi:hypothetical protein